MANLVKSAQTLPIGSRCAEEALRRTRASLFKEAGRHHEPAETNLDRITQLDICRSHLVLFCPSTDTDHGWWRR